MASTVTRTTEMTILAVFICCLTVRAQRPVYPKEIRGYKVELRTVEMKKSAKKLSNEPDPEPLIRLGNPQLAGVTPLGISLEIPIVVAPVQQKGRVDFLVFEDMLVNDTAVEIDEYHRGFELPNKEPLTLPEPLRFYIYLPRAVLVALDDWNDSRSTWLVTGRIYVFGKFKKSILSFKRCIPVELKVTMPNPLNETYP
jgi:hypothetical protein